MAKSKLEHDIDVDRQPVFTPRFILALLLIGAGIAWIYYYYTGVRPSVLGEESAGAAPKVGKYGEWNYVAGFALFFLGLIVSAHPRTPLGRGRGVVVGMLGCFLLGLIWICVFYIWSNDLSPIWVFNDLGNWNLMVGIAFMGVGFAFATRWE